MDNCGCLKFKVPATECSSTPCKMRQTRPPALQEKYIAVEARTSLLPLLKWPGGKRSLADQILEQFPDSFGKYFEPFVGGGAVFFALRPNRASLSDLNEELINCYRFVRDDPDALLGVLRTFRNSEEMYYKIRASNPRAPLRRAARLLYLTRLSFNGIHRVNLRVVFNVPYGQKTHLEPYDEDAIRNTSEALQSACLLAADFESATERAQDGDLVYFDPPYTVAHANNGFVKYNERIFSWADQVRLATVARQLCARGCTVIVSNADHPSLCALYSDIETRTLQRYSVISASSDHRRKISEFLFVMRSKCDAGKRLSLALCRPALADCLVN